MDRRKAELGAGPEFVRNVTVGWGLAVGLEFRFLDDHPAAVNVVLHVKKLAHFALEKRETFPASGTALFDVRQLFSLGFERVSDVQAEILVKPVLQKTILRVGDLRRIRRAEVRRPIREKHDFGDLGEELVPQPGDRHVFFGHHRPNIDPLICPVGDPRAKVRLPRILDLYADVPGRHLTPKPAECGVTVSRFQEAKTGHEILNVLRSLLIVTRENRDHSRHSRSVEKRRDIFHPHELSGFPQVQHERARHRVGTLRRDGRFFRAGTRIVEEDHRGFGVSVDHQPGRVTFGTLGGSPDRDGAKLRCEREGKRKESESKNEPVHHERKPAFPVRIDLRAG